MTLVVLSTIIDRCLTPPTCHTCDLPTDPTPLPPVTVTPPPTSARYCRCSCHRRPHQWLNNIRFITLLLTIITFKESQTIHINRIVCVCMLVAFLLSLLISYSTMFVVIIIIIIISSSSSSIIFVIISTSKIDKVGFRALRIARAPVAASAHPPHPGPERSTIRPFFILRIVRPRIFESKLWNHRAKKLDGALRRSTSFV